MKAAVIIDKISANLSVSMSLFQWGEMWVCMFVECQPACPQPQRFKDSCIALHVLVLTIQSLLIIIFAYLKVLITFNQMIHEIWQIMAV